MRGPTRIGCVRHGVSESSFKVPYELLRELGSDGICTKDCDIRSMMIFRCSSEILISSCAPCANHIRSVRFTGLAQNVACHIIHLPLCTGESE
jgi:hypothetical protein